MKNPNYQAPLVFYLFTFCVRFFVAFFVNCDVTIVVYLEDYFVDKCHSFVSTTIVTFAMRY